MYKKNLVKLVPQTTQYELLKIPRNLEISKNLKCYFLCRNYEGGIFFLSAEYNMG